MSIIPPFFTKLFDKGKADSELKNVPMGNGEWIRQEFDKSWAYHNTDLDRENTNWKMYGAFDYGQWDDEAVAALKEQGRHIPQYNIIRDKVESLAGNLIKDFFDMKFLPVDGKFTPFTRALRELMMSDKELMDWEFTYDQVVLDGLVFRGVEQMVVSDRYSPLGNIAFERCIPGSIIVDPYWRSNNSWDLKSLFKVAYMTARMMKDIYDTKSDMIDFEIQKILNAGNDYDQSDQTDALPYRNFETQIGSEYRILEYHYIKVEKRKIRYSVLGDVVPEGSEEYQREWAEINGFDFDKHTYEDKKKVNIYYVTSVVPELNNLILEDKMSEIQIGRLPFFFFSAARINGRDSGIVDLLVDPQQTINKRESMIDDMIASSAKGGLLVDEEIFGDDPRAVNEFKNNGTKPGYVGIVAGGVTIQDKIYKLPSADFPSTAINDENRMMDLADRLSKVTPAQEGRSERSGESGILNSQKRLQTEINQTILVKNIAHFHNEKGEAYMLLAQQLYSNVYREFSINGGRETLMLNEHKPDGSISLDISKMPRHKVIIDQSPQGASQRIVDRSINADILVKIGGTSPLYAAKATGNIFKTLDHSMEERDEYTEISKLVMENAILKTQAENVQMQTMIAQGSMQMEQLQNPQQQPVEGQPQTEQGVQPPQ